MIRSLPLRRGLALAACALALAAPPAGAATGAPAAEIAWLPAASDADVDRAFAQARGERKPLLLYWGAKWCPPCNQLKATLFNRQDFIERSRAFVAVNVDGDLPGAQKLGRRFRVSGYPTLVLFSGTDNPTTLNFLPDNHIVVIEAKDIVADYETMWAALRARFGKGVMPRTVNWVTGPSRSADIEQTLLLGAHGPRRLHVIVVGG